MKKAILLFCVLGVVNCYAQSRIAYQSNEAGSFDIWTMDEFGFDKQRITFNDTTNEQVPKFSPDGRRIAYRGDQTKLMIVNHDGSNPTLVKDFGHYFYLFEWSDSDWIYVAVNLPGCFPNDLRKIRPDGSEEVILRNGIPVHGATEGENGEVLFVQTVYCWTPNSRIKVMDINGNNERVVRPNDNKAEFWPRKANHANVVAFHQSDSPRGFNEPVNIHLMDWDGAWSEPVTHARPRESFLTPVFSPDDEEIASGHFYNGNWNIVKMNVDGTAMEVLTDPHFDASDPDWGPAGCSFGLESADFVRERGKPRLHTLSFESCEGDGILRITNTGVASAYVFLNGMQIFKPNDFNGKTQEIYASIALNSGENILSVELRGMPGTSLTINIE